MGTVQKKTVKRARSPASTHSTDMSTSSKKQKKMNVTGSTKKFHEQKPAITEIEASIKPPMPENNNGRIQGRQLIRWNPHVDQLLLLCIHYECQRAGIVLPWDAIAFRLSAEKFSTGPCITQHIQKLRTQMFDRGAWVPPILGRKSAKKTTDIRGIVKVHPNRKDTRFVLWHEDASMLISPTDIDKVIRSGDNLGPGKFIKNELDDGEPQTPSTTLSSISRVKRGGSARNQLITVKKEALSDDGDIDPAQLPSDDDFNPNLSAKGKGRRKAATKSRKKSNIKKEDSDSDIDFDDETKNKGAKVDFNSPDAEDGNKKPITRGVSMMPFNDEEEIESPMTVLKNFKAGALSKFPSGISGSGGENDTSDDLHTDADNEGDTYAEAEEEESTSEIKVSMEVAQFNHIEENIDSVITAVQDADTADPSFPLPMVSLDASDNNQLFGKLADNITSTGGMENEPAYLSNEKFANPVVQSIDDPGLRRNSNGNFNSPQVTDTGFDAFSTNTNSFAADGIFMETDGQGF